MTAMLAALADVPHRIRRLTLALMVLVVVIQLAQAVGHVGLIAALRRIGGGHHSRGEVR
jgi:hypothetical protein